MLGQIAVGGGLITVRGALVGLGLGLIGIGDCLVRIGCGLIGVGRRLVRVGSLLAILDLPALVRDCSAFIPRERCLAAICWPPIRLVHTFPSVSVAGGGLSPPPAP